MKGGRSGPGKQEQDGCYNSKTTVQNKYEALVFKNYEEIQDSNKSALNHSCGLAECEALCPCAAGSHEAGPH